MAKKICILGMTGSGKTCYMYALAQIMQMGVSSSGVKLSVIQNNPEDQAEINDNIERMLDERKWPQATNADKTYDLCVRTHAPEYKDIVPSLILKDYKGGVLQKQEEDVDKYKELMASFQDSVSVIFLVDAKILLQGIDEENLSEEHRGIYGNSRDKRLAVNSIIHIESILRDYKARNQTLPPVMIAVTKSDLLSNMSEKNYAMAFIREYLPSVFAKGSGVDAGICCVSLGENLKDVGGDIIGELNIDPSSNIHLPFLFALYNYLDSVYEGSTPKNRKLMDTLFVAMQKMFDQKLQIYTNGEIVIPSN